MPAEARRSSARSNTCSTPLTTPPPRPPAAATSDANRASRRPAPGTRRRRRPAGRVPRGNRGRGGGQMQRPGDRHRGPLPDLRLRRTSRRQQPPDAGELDGERADVGPGVLVVIPVTGVTDLERVDHQRLRLSTESGSAVSMASCRYISTRPRRSRRSRSGSRPRTVDIRSWSGPLRTSSTGPRTPANTTACAPRSRAGKIETYRPLFPPTGVRRSHQMSRMVTRPDADR